MLILFILFTNNEVDEVEYKVEIFCTAYPVIRKDVRHAPYAHRRWKCPIVFVNSAP